MNTRSNTNNLQLSVRGAKAQTLCYKPDINFLRLKKGYVNSIMAGVMVPPGWGRERQKCPTNLTKIYHQLVSDFSKIFNDTSLLSKSDEVSYFFTKTTDFSENLYFLFFSCHLSKNTFWACRMVS